MNEARKIPYRVLNRYDDEPDERDMLAESSLLPRGPARTVAGFLGVRLGGEAAPLGQFLQHNPVDLGVPRSSEAGQ